MRRFKARKLPSFDDLYQSAKNGNLHKAERIWRDGLRRGSMNDIKTWGFMMKLYADNGHHHRTLDLFRSISSSQRLQHNHITILTALRACCHLRDEEGLKMIITIHSEMERNKISDNKIRSVLIEAYSKCGDLMSAKVVFESLNNFQSALDIQSVKAMLTAYSENNDHRAVIALFDKSHKMESNKLTMDSVCYLIVLNACCKSENFERGKNIHRKLMKSEIECDLKIQTQFIDIYGKSGDLVTAQSLFDDIKEEDRDDVLWTTLIRCYGFNGKINEALALWTEWKDNNEMESVSYLVMIGVCSHCGAIDEAIKIFAESKKTQKCNEKIYAAMMDGYARRGRLNEGWDLLLEFESIYGSESKAYGHVIMALFHGARTQNDLEIAESLYSRIKTTTFYDPSDNVLQTATTLMRQIYHQNQGSVHGEMQFIIDGICLNK